MNKRWMKILAVLIFLLAIALLVYSLAPGTTITDTTPVAPILLVPPAGAP